MTSREHAFNLYEALEVTVSASQQDIVSSYRKLALRHHPDRNPDDENATANFQRIQAAHETLSDPTKRSRYDHSLTHPASARTEHARHHYFDDDDDDDINFDEDDFLDEIFGRFRRGPPQNFGGRGGVGGGFPQFFPGNYGGYVRPSYDEMEALFHAQEAHDAEVRKREREANRIALEKAESMRKANEAAKKLKEENEKTAREQKDKEEVTKQERIWEEAGAKTNREKQKLCLHSHFWQKIQQKSKFQCKGCMMKKGPVAFKCPHCQMMVCQTCNLQYRKELEETEKGS